MTDRPPPPKEKANTRGNARRRRISFLATSSFVATSILAGGSVFTAVMTPSIALADKDASVASHCP